MTPSLHVTVTGKVQGVFFRAWVFDQAKSLGLTGWVRNIEEGKVEILAQGNPEGLKTFKERLPQGSPLARVANVSSEMIEYDKQYPEFSIHG